MEDPSKPESSDLRAEIAELLRAEDVDYGRILSLAAALASSDPNNVRFSVDAGHISRLGRELVSRQETAVAELVKNAFDADATSVTLTFHDAAKRGGSLDVVDDGIGMDREDLIRGFMRLSSTMKVHSPRSPRFGRQRAGRKGIGRFAAQRLGEVLTITTQVADGFTALQVRIDWSAFESDLELSSIGSRIVEVPKERDHGTTLRIERLREHWTDALVRRAYRFILGLTPPFPLTPGKRQDEAPLDPGFKVVFRRATPSGVTVLADEQQMLLDHALAVIDGTVDDRGVGRWSVVSRPLKVSDKDQAIGAVSESPLSESPLAPFAYLRNVRFRAYYYIVESRYIPQQALAGVKAALSSSGGVRVYRNGFRVLPYGETSDDWLGLNESYRRRVLLVPHGNENIFGYVELTDPEGALFEETSSREGLLNNAAFTELVDFTSRAVKAGIVRVNVARGVKITAGQRDWTPKAPNPVDRVRSVADELSEAAARMSATAGSSDLGVEPAGGGRPVHRGDAPSPADLRRLAQGLSDAAAEQDAESERLLKEIGMLRVLASLGLVIGEFTHEIRQYLPAIQADSDYFASLNLQADAAAVAERLRANVAAFRTYAAYFDHAISDNATRHLGAIEIRDAVNAFTRTVEPSLSRAGITLDAPAFEGYRLFTRPMHASEWASILFNFFTNSRKAIARRGKPGRISLRAGREGGMIFLEFADNGDGIREEHQDRIFNAFFTTATPTRRRGQDHDDPTGTGLGLTIIRDIVSAYGGTVSLIAPPADFVTAFRLEIPEAQPSDIEEADY